jgi:hypothetical protein
MTIRASAKQRWQHIKERAVREGVAFALSVDFFESAIRSGIAVEDIFPDHTPRDKAAWKAIRAAVKARWEETCRPKARARPAQAPRRRAPQ